MRMPEFTAEASLYRTSERYTHGAAAGAAGGGTILPQFCYSPRPNVFCCWTPWFGWSCRRLLTVE